MDETTELMRETLMHKSISLILIVFALAFVSSSLAAPVPVGEEVAPIEPLDVYPRTTTQVVDFVRRNHFSQNSKLDDEVSSEIFDQYLERLDPRKAYLLAEDIAEFEDYRYKIDDALKMGKLVVAFEIFNRVHQRQLARLDWILNRLSQGIESFDLNSKQTLMVRDENTYWPIDQDDADDLWEKILLDIIIRERLDDENGEEDVIATLVKRYERNRKYVTQTNSDDAYQTFINAFTTWFDPHTEYLPPRAVDQFDTQMSLRLQGIGALLGMDEEFIQIQSLLAGGPAELNGGVKEKDRIVSVGQDPTGPLTDVVGWRLSDVVELIRGPKGTTVILELKQPDEASESRIVAIVRDEIKLEQSAASKRVLDIESGGQTRKIGVIDLPSMYVDFEAKRKNDPDYRSATRDVRRLISELKSEGIEGLIIDLRANGGGSLDEAHSLTGLFVPTGPTVVVKQTGRRPETWRDMNPEQAWDGPLAVIVDYRSASASEIFAGAIQDYGRGLVVGNQTYGKGTVQQLLPVRYGQLKITQAKYYRISGESTQHKGVIPDIEFPLPIDSSRFGESRFDTALAHDVIEGPIFKTYGDLSPYIGELQQLHHQRTLNNPDFVYQRALEQRFTEDTEESEISLNEEERRKERDSYNEWWLDVNNVRLVAKGVEPAKDIDELSKIRTDRREAEKDEADEILIETGHILNDLIKLNNPLALVE